MQGFWDFLTNNKDAITGFVAILGIIGSILGVLWAAWKLLIERWWKHRLRVDVKVFEVITDPAVLLPRLYATENDNSPLADHNIKYQPRDPNRDLQTELKAALNRSRYLLITAPTGYGKTREAGLLAQTMMLEGWRVLRIRTGWLDTPKELPAELNSNRSRVLILLDDLNGLFSTGELTQSPRAEQMPIISQTSYHHRLLKVLNTLESMCTEQELRVLATARSEANQWKLLDYSENDKLWKKFERIEIAEPADATIVKLLEDATKQVDLKANVDEFEAIAHKNDGTYRNILLNLRRMLAQNKTVTKDEFTDTLNGSWQEIYEHAVKRYIAVHYIYDAIDILQQAKIELFPFLVEPTATLVWGGNPFQKFLRERKIRRALHYLTDETKIIRLSDGILAPSDGQIEARNRKLTKKLTNPSAVLENILTKFGKHQSDILLNSFLSFGVKLALQGSQERAIDLWKVGARVHPHIYFWFNQGVAFKELKRYDEAETAYRKAIDLNPSDATAYNNLGNLLSDENLKRYDEAEAAYRKAIDLNPSDATAYSNLGLLLHENLKRYDEAEAAYRKAIELEPSNDYRYIGLINLFRFDYNRPEDALPLLAKRLELNRENFNAPLAFASINKQLGKEIAKENMEQARQFMPENDWYNRACLESVCDNLDLAFENLEKAARTDDFDPSWAWDDPDFQWIKDDARFTKIVGAKPE